MSAKCPPLSREGLLHLWAQMALGHKLASSEARLLALSHPIKQEDPLSEVLARLILQAHGLACSPLHYVRALSLQRDCASYFEFGSLHFFSQSVVPLSLPDLRQLAPLWAIAGEREAAAALTHLLPFEFPWLWCKEHEYLEEECGEHKLNSSFHTENSLHAGLTFSGNQTGLGSMISPCAQIRTFGPQGFPLSCPQTFGIRFQPISQHENRWASPVGLPNVWFEMAASQEKEIEGNGSKILLDLSFFGMNLDQPLSFSFYIKAKSASVGKDPLPLRSLVRYRGGVQTIYFGKSLRIESLGASQLEVIPLAGDRSFWGADYLAAFHLHPMNPKVSFSIIFDP